MLIKIIKRNEKGSLTIGLRGRLWHNLFPDWNFDAKIIKKIKKVIDFSRLKIRSQSTKEEFKLKENCKSKMSFLGRNLPKRNLNLTFWHFSAIFIYVRSQSTKEEFKPKTTN